MIRKWLIRREINQPTFTVTEISLLKPFFFNECDFFNTFIITVFPTIINKHHVTQIEMIRNVSTQPFSLNTIKVIKVSYKLAKRKETGGPSILIIVHSTRNQDRRRGR